MKTKIAEIGMAADFRRKAQIGRGYAQAPALAEHKCALLMFQVASGVWHARWERAF